MSLEEQLEAGARLNAAVMALPEEKRACAAEWINAALQGDADSVEFGMVTNIVKGHMEIADVTDEGELMFRLTQEGGDHVLELLHTDEEMRSLMERLSGQPYIVPKREQ